jgi:hypothetical protein
MSDHFKVLVVEQVLDIATRTREEIVDAHDNSSIAKQALAQMRAKETGPAGH